MENGKKKSLSTKICSQIVEYAKEKTEKFRHEFETVSSLDSPKDIMKTDNLSHNDAVQQVITTVDTSFKKFEELKKKIEDARNKAKEAQNSAREAAEKSINWLGWGKTEAIEALQNTVENQSKAEIALVESQELLFQQQQTLAQCTKALFGLCCTNIHYAEIAVEQISEHLEGAKRKKISDVVQQEMWKFVQQLKNQISIYDRFEKFKSATEEEFENYQAWANDIDDKQEKIKIQLKQFEEKMQAKYFDQLQTIVNKVNEASQTITW